MSNRLNASWSFFKMRRGLTMRAGGLGGNAQRIGAGRGRWSLEAPPPERRARTAVAARSFFRFDSWSAHQAAIPIRGVYPELGEGLGDLLEPFGGWIALMRTAASFYASIQLE